METAFLQGMAYKEVIEVGHSSETKDVNFDFPGGSAPPPTASARAQVCVMFRPRSAVRFRALKTRWGATPLRANPE
eukprot:2718106-Lingulodinium_polyedra.AAC.1